MYTDRESASNRELKKKVGGRKNEMQNEWPEESLLFLFSFTPQLLLSESFSIGQKETGGEALTATQMTEILEQ